MYNDNSKVIHSASSYSFQVRFSQPHIVRNVYTQGRPFTSDPANREQWVTKFQVQHSLDCVNFYKYNNWDGTALVYIPIYLWV